jgi:hypothetical protein
MVTYFGPSGRITGWWATASEAEVRRVIPRW